MRNLHPLHIREITGWKSPGCYRGERSDNRAEFIKSIYVCHMVNLIFIRDIVPHSLVFFWNSERNVFMRPAEFHKKFSFLNSEKNQLSPPCHSAVALLSRFSFFCLLLLFSRLEKAQHSRSNQLHTDFPRRYTHNKKIEAKERKKERRKMSLKKKSYTRSCHWRPRRRDWCNLSASAPHSGKSRCRP